MSFKVSYNYKLREGLTPGASVSVPTGTVEEFAELVKEILERDSGKPEFRFKAEFG